jgi:hypothetical protein
MYNHSYWFKASLGKKLVKAHLKKQAGVVVCAYDPKYLAGE